MAEPRITERGRRTRQRIIEATGEQILATGIGGTTLDDVRAATLTSKSQLFHYFPGGKIELVREVAEWEGRQLLEAQEPHIHDLGRWESWEAWRTGLVDYYIGRGRWACPIGSLATQAAAVDAELERTIAASMRAWRAFLARGVERMREAGLVAAERGSRAHRHRDPRGHPGRPGAQPAGALRLAAGGGARHRARAPCT